MIWLLPHLLPLSRQQVVYLSQPSCVSPVELAGGSEGGRDGGGAQSYDSGNKAWPLVNHSILSDRINDSNGNEEAHRESFHCINLVSILAGVHRVYYFHCHTYTHTELHKYILPVG
jgi:hypothetical protein